MGGGCAMNARGRKREEERRDRGSSRVREEEAIEGKIEEK